MLEKILNLVKKPKKEESKSIVINNIDVRPARRDKQNIQTWRSALKIAEGWGQQRSLIFNCYEEILLDSFLAAVIEKRIAKILKCNLRCVKEGVENDQVKMLMNKSFVEKLNREALLSKFWGHSLLEVYWPAPGGTVGETNLIPRKHVKPRFGIVTKNEFDTTGINYREEAIAKNLIEIGDNENLGILLTVAQYVIYKRGNFGDWAEFAEVFGMPFRWATYNNPESRKILEEAMKNAGSAGYVVAPEDAKLQFFNPTAGSASNDIFRFMLQACNQEISIGVLGNSMTTVDSKNAGFAQAETQSESQDDIHAMDRSFIEKIWNEKVTPYLISIGYSLEGYEWQFEEEDNMSLKDRITIDIQLADQINIPDDYWHDKYRIPRANGPVSEKKKVKVKD